MPKLSATVPQNTTVALTTATAAKAQQKILQPDREEIVDEVHAIGLVAQGVKYPDMAIGKADEHGQHEQAAGGAQHKAQRPRTRAARDGEPLLSRPAKASHHTA
jgi:hypothetical protein